MGTNISGDQFQVIIGNDVAKVFDAMVKENPAIQQTTENKEPKSDKKQNVVLKIFETIAGVFAPMLQRLLRQVCSKDYLHYSCL